MPRIPSRNQVATLAVPLALVVLTCVVFWQTAGFELTNLDDNRYITQNPALEQGLSPDGIAWAFSNRIANLWMPVTWLTFLADQQFFGATPAALHRTNVLWHLASTLLLYFLLRRLSGATWRSALVAVLFAVHPLHVESVAWVAERKDVVSGFFFLAAINCYVGYDRRPAAWRFAAVMFVFALALMAKPMTVTLPVVLLILDFHRREDRRPVRQLILEKIPLLLLSLAIAILTWRIVQTRDLGAPDPIPLLQRLGQAISFYALYVGKMFAPVNLAVSYPPESLRFPWPRVLIWAVLLFSLTGAAWRSRDRMRPVWLGWLAYLVMLLPVAGIVQGGMQLMSDRYFYLPSLGLFTALAWLLHAAVERRPRLRWAIAALAIAAVVAATVTAQRQTRHWSDSGALYRHALIVNPDNYLALANLGVMLADEGRAHEALPYLQRAVELRRDAVHLFNLANVLAKLERPAEAIGYYRAAVAVQPEFPEAQNNLGIALAQEGQVSEARRCFELAVEQRRDYAGAWYNLGLMQLNQGETSAAAASFRRTLELQPGHADARRRLDSLSVGSRR